MKKKIIKISLLVTIVLLCSACNGNVTRSLRHDGFSIGKKFICDEFYNGDNKIKYITDNNIIDDNGYIYDISLEQIYSNNQNCKKANTDIVVKAIYDNKIIKSKDNKYYYLKDGDNTPRYSLVKETDDNYELYNILLKEEDVLKVMTIDNNKGVYYILKNDGNVYSYIITKADINSFLRIISRSIIYDKTNYGVIIDFNYAGDSSSTYLKTIDSVYRMKATNYDSCSKYADVDCIYKIEKDEVFEKYNDKIIAYNGNIVITDYKQVFNVSN